MPDLAPTNGHDLTDAEARAAAQAMWRHSEAAGDPLTGVDLGRAFGKTDRWGRKQIERARSGHDRSASRATAAQPRPRRSISSPAGSQPRRKSANPLVDGAGRDSTLVRTSGTPVASAATERSARSWPDAVVVLVVAAVAAAASHGHMLEVALAAGEPLWIARAFPTIVDGLVVAALRRGEAGRHWLALAVAVSVAANVLAQFPEHAPTIGPAVSAWPPIALFGTHRLLQR
jgi:hypothetical protein